MGRDLKHQTDPLTDGRDQTAAFIRPCSPPSAQLPLVVIVATSRGERPSTPPPLDTQTVAHIE
ncbi:hypothetical protein ABVT39_023810 [Epinephelus coioides]